MLVCFIIWGASSYCFKTTKLVSFHKVHAQALISDFFSYYTSYLPIFSSLQMENSMKNTSTIQKNMEDVQLLNYRLVKSGCHHAGYFELIAQHSKQGNL